MSDEDECRCECVCMRVTEGHSSKQALLKFSIALQNNYWRKDCYCGRSSAFGWEINNNHRAFWHIVYYCWLVFDCYGVFGPGLPLYLGWELFVLQRGSLKAAREYDGFPGDCADGCALLLTDWQWICMIFSVRLLIGQSNILLDMR